MKISNITVHGEQPPRAKFMAYIKNNYGLDSSINNYGEWSFDGPEDKLFELAKDLFCLDGFIVKSFMEQK